MGILNIFRRNGKTQDSGRGHHPRVMVIGLDCAEPGLVFDRWANDLPNLTALARRGAWGELESSTPAITVPAWTCMVSSKDPGTLGIYGFRNRSDHTYDHLNIANGNSVHVKRVWDYLGEAGKTSVVIGVPPTYPVKPVNGYLVSCFLTPGVQSPFAYPPELKDEILAITPDYDFDVGQFRTNNKDWLHRQIVDMTEKRFRIIDHLLQDKPWDFFMVMEIGVDRIHHGFWQYHDPQHFRYTSGNPYETVIHDYYVRIDEKIGEWVKKAGEDTAILVVSDHGAKRMDGGICINEWLLRNGWLALHQEPKPGEKVRFEDLDVDWSRTRAWGDGGYYGRIFFNVQGREPQGIIPPEDYENVQDELMNQLIAIPDHQGKDMGTRVFKPKEIYREVNGVAPDLIVYFGDLYWRSVGTLGHGSIYTFENDTGPDDCNHAQYGMAIFYDPTHPGQGARLRDAQLMDVAPTILEWMGIPVPEDMQGQSLRSRLPIQHVVK